VEREIMAKIKLDLHKYRVFVHGQNLLTQVDGVRQRIGFYTNVFIEAVTSADAEARAIELIRQDAHLRDIILNPDDDPLNLTVDEVQEIESFNGVQLPRTGFTLYPEKNK
jgi:hypothetical protein